METPIIAGVIVGVLLLLMLSIMLMWRKVSQDKALVVTGLKKRVISGGGGLVIPLFEKVQALQPGIRCIFMSGYTADVIAHHGVLEDGIHFLQKPFTVHALTKMIRETIERKDP